MNLPLAATHASYEDRGPGQTSLTVVLAPFTFQGERVVTAIRLDAIAGLPMPLERAAGRCFSFPVNPETGYIDGSMYVGARHWPVDIHGLRFGAAISGFMALEIRGQACADSLPRPNSFPIELETRVELHASDHQIAREVRAAIDACQAKSPRDVGRVVALVKKRFFYRSDVARAAEVAADLLVATAPGPAEGA